MTNFRCVIGSKLARCFAIVLLIGVGLTISSPVSADCMDLLSNPTENMDWHEDEPRWVQGVAGPPTVPMKYGPLVAISVPAYMLGGIDQESVDPLFTVALLPACVSYESLSMPFELLDIVINGRAENGADTQVSSEQAVERTDRTPISPPDLGPEPQHQPPAGRYNDEK